MKQNDVDALEETLAGGLSPTDEAPGMTPSERRATLALGLIYALRMLGLFMILPVFTLYADDYTGFTPTLAGLAIGAYGLTQALLQIPFGMLSDRVGRKPVVYGGLLLFAAGSALAAASDSIYGVIAGRALQGAGAIAAAVMALVADLTREEHRTKAMAGIGASIGLSFALALILGPVISRWTGLEGLFWVTCGLALGGMACLRWLVPSSVRTRTHRDTGAIPAQFARVLSDGQLLRLDAGILVLHLILTASFVAVPLALRDYGGLPGTSHWQVYLFVLVVSVALMVPCVVVAERHHRSKEVFVAAVALLSAALAGLVFGHRELYATVALMILFFTAFNVLEASLPAMISRLAPSTSKGTALGVYSTSQFLGAFLGGLAGGWLQGRFGAGAVFATCAALGAGWLALAASMRRPPALSSRLLSVGPLDEGQASKLAARLSGVAGVAEAVVVIEDGVAYLKVDRAKLDEQRLHEALAGT